MRGAEAPKQDPNSAVCLGNSMRLGGQGGQEDGSG